MSLSTGQMQIRDEDRMALLSWTRSSSIKAALALRARIVLAAADGERTSSICHRLGVSRSTISLWKKRYASHGLGWAVRRAAVGPGEECRRCVDHRAGRWIRRRSGWE